MTTLSQRVVRETSSPFRGDPILVKWQRKAIFVRTKGSRRRARIPYTAHDEMRCMNKYNHIGFSQSNRQEGLCR